VVNVDANPRRVACSSVELDEMLIPTKAPNGCGLWMVKMTYGPYGVRELPHDWGAQSVRRLRVQNAGMQGYNKHKSM